MVGKIFPPEISSLILSSVGLHLIVLPSLYFHPWHITAFLFCAVTSFYCNVAHAVFIQGLLYQLRQLKVPLGTNWTTERGPSPACSEVSTKLAVRVASRKLKPWSLPSKTCMLHPERGGSPRRLWFWAALCPCTVTPSSGPANWQKLCLVPSKFCGKPECSVLAASSLWQISTVSYLSWAIYLRSVAA